MDPTEGELQAINNLDEARAWAGVVGHEARLESLRRVCCLRSGRPVDMPGHMAVPAAPAVAPAPFPPAGGGALGVGPPPPQARKLKLSAVLDPTLDAEIQPLTDA